MLRTNKDHFPETTEKLIINDFVIPNYGVIIGDTHFGRFSNDPAEIEESLEYFEKFFFPYLYKLNQKFGNENVCVIQVGDIFDNKTAIGIVANNIVIEIFSHIAKTNKCIVIVGNHDTVYKEIREINNSKSLSLIDGVKVITRLTEMKTKSEEIISFMPNYDIKEKLELAVNNASENSYLFGHDEIAGFSYEGKIIKEGKSISSSMFKKFKRVIFGHIHKSQSAENITYIGSAFQTRMNEWQNENMFGVINFNSSELFFIKNTYSPRYKKINLFDLMNMKVSEAKEYVKNSKVTVLCPNDTIIRIATYKITPLIEGYKKIDYKQLYQDNDSTDNQDLLKEEFADDIDSINMSSDLNEQIFDYIEKTDSVILNKNLVTISPKLKEKLKEKLKTLYDEASEGKKTFTEENEL